jgi:hypothetical protein
MGWQQDVWARLISFDIGGLRDRMGPVHRSHWSHKSHLFRKPMAMKRFAVPNTPPRPS